MLPIFPWFSLLLRPCFLGVIFPSSAALYGPVPFGPVGTTWHVPPTTSAGSLGSQSCQIVWQLLDKELFSFPVVEAEVALGIFLVILFLEVAQENIRNAFLTRHFKGRLELEAWLMWARQKLICMGFDEMRNVYGHISITPQHGVS